MAGVKQESGTVVKPEPRDDCGDDDDDDDATEWDDDLTVIRVQVDLTLEDAKSVEKLVVVPLETPTYEDHADDLQDDIQDEFAIQEDEIQDEDNHPKNSDQLLRDIGSLLCLL